MFMREYELTYITKPDLEEEHLERIAARTSEMLEKTGHILHREVWGKRKLAYDIQKFSKGHYYHFNFLSGPEPIPEVERALRLDDSVLRYLTVKVKDRVNVEVRIEEARQKEAEMAARRREEDDEEAPSQRRDDEEE